MKEAAGEANMTVITIVLIAIVLGVGIIIVPRMMNKTSASACCTNDGGIWKDGKCYHSKDCSVSNGTTTCTGKEYTPICKGEGADK